MAEVERVADRVGLIDDGHLAQELTMEELRRQTTGRIRFSFNDPPPSDDFGSVAGVTSVEVSGTDVFVQVDGPVTDVLTRAAQLGAIQIQQRDELLEPTALAPHGLRHRAGHRADRR